jgi:hypothetical protein
MLRTKRMRTISVALIGFAVMGCSSSTPSELTLSAGRYTLVMDSTDILDGETEHSELECTVTLDGPRIVVTSLPDVGRWFAGTVDGNQVALILCHKNPDPMIEAMQLRSVLEGRIQATDHAAGRVNGYAGTNNYIKGTWVLKKIGHGKASGK